jgi:hypothetical protein
MITRFSIGYRTTKNCLTIHKILNKRREIFVMIAKIELLICLRLTWKIISQTLLNGMRLYEKKTQMNMNEFVSNKMRRMEKEEKRQLQCGCKTSQPKIIVSSTQKQFSVLSFSSNNKKLPFLYRHRKTKIRARFSLNDKKHTQIFLFHFFSYYIIVEASSEEFFYPKPR